MQRQPFDQQWQFHLGPMVDSRRSKLDHITWRSVDLPHDWSIELAHAPDSASGADGGYFPMGLGTYRKTFVAPEEWRDQKVYVEFEGVYMNADVWLNGHFLGRHPYGYTSFHDDLTPYLDLGAENQLQVRVDNACQPNSRWYSGSGIYRHVWLIVAQPVHVAHWGVSVTTPQVSPEEAIVHVQTSVENESGAACEATVRCCIATADGTPVETAEAPLALDLASRGVCAQDLTVAEPRLWSPDSPALYQLQTEVLVDDQVVDTASTPFGIRRLDFDAGRGFLLNGRPLLLRGGCVHHDDGVMGAAAYDRAEERKVELLKANGFNAVRCAHNPPAPAFLDACDRLGMLVIDEAFDCWRDGKRRYDYHVNFDDWWQRDMDSMLYRDRNHPAIIMWSIGNELVERGRPEGSDIAHMLADRVRAVDPTRPVTVALCAPWGEEWSWPQLDVTFSAVDVCGYNYQQKQYQADHERRPERIIYGSESTAREAFEHWMSVLEMDSVIGDFVWTALDYVGEAGIGRVHFEGTQEVPHLGAYPWHQANCGDLDLCGFKRPQSYYRDVLWKRGDPLYIAVHSPTLAGKTPGITYWGWPDVWPNWTWPDHEDQAFTVDVYSACERVELFLNGESLGVRPTTRRERFSATFTVDYRPGVLKAVGYAEDEAIAECEIETVGDPARIRLTPDRRIIKATAGDLSFVTVEIVDRDGRLHPTAAHEVFFTTQGNGSIVAVGNGNPVSNERYRGNRRKAHRGRCLVVVRSHGEPGQVTLRAQADGLAGAEVVIQLQ